MAQSSEDGDIMKSMNANCKLERIARVGKYKFHTPKPLAYYY